MAKKSYNLSLFFVAYVFPWWGNTSPTSWCASPRFPQDPFICSWVHGQNQPELPRALRGDWPVWPLVTENSGRESAVLSSVPKTAFPLHVQTEPLGTPTTLAGCLSPAPLALGAGVQEQMEQRCSRGWIWARLSLQRCIRRALCLN